MKKFDIYILVFFVIAIISQITHFDKLFYIAYTFLLLLYLSQGINSFEYLLLTLFYPNKIIQFLGLALFVVCNLKKILVRVNKLIVIFLMWITFTSLINILFFNGSILNMIVELGIYVVYFLIIMRLQQEGPNNLFANRVTKLFWIQVFIATIQIIQMRGIDDVVKGTLISAHYLGIFLIAFAYHYYYYCKNNRINKVIKWITFSTVILFLWLSDAKHVYFAFLITLVIFNLTKSLKIKHTVVILACCLCIFTIGGGTFLNDATIETKLESSLPDIAQYVYNPLYNQKYEYFRRTYQKLKPPRCFIGFGIGQYGSQIAISRGYNEIYNEKRANNSSNFEAFITPEYSYAIGGLINRGYVENIKNISMVLSYPLVSFIPFVAELGIVGMVLFWVILQKWINNSENEILILFFFILCIFDTYFEIPNVFVMLMLFVYSSTNNIKIKSYKR